MARYLYGGTADSLVITRGSGGALQLAPEDAVVTWWTAVSSGVQHTDLREVDGATVIAGGVVHPNEDGQVRSVLLPDGVGRAWRQAGAGPRVEERGRSADGSPPFSAAERTTLQDLQGAVAGEATARDAAIGTALADEVARADAAYPTEAEAQPRQTALWVGPTALQPAIGAPALAIANALTPVMAFDADAQEQAAVVFEPPAWWTAITVDLLWMNLTADAGNVYWRVTVGNIAIGSSAPAGGSLLQTPFAASTVQYRVIRSTLGPWAIDPTRLVILRLDRVGNSGSDTKLGDAGLVGLQVRQG